MVIQTRSRNRSNPTLLPHTFSDDEILAPHTRPTPITTSSTPQLKKKKTDANNKKAVNNKKNANLRRRSTRLKRVPSIPSLSTLKLMKDELALSSSHESDSSSDSGGKSSQDTDQESEHTQDDEGHPPLHSMLLEPTSHLEDNSEAVHTPPEHEVIKPFRSANSESIKFNPPHKLARFETMEPSALRFVPLLSEEEPAHAVELRRTLFLQSLSCLEKAYLETQEEACQEACEKLMHFIHHAWDEQSISSRCIDTLPTALVCTNGLDPYFVFQTIQRHLQKMSDVVHLLFPSESVTQLTSMIAPILRLYASTDTEDIDALPRHQSPLFACLIPSFETFPSSLLSHFITMLPKGFRIVFVAGLASRTSLLETALLPKAYRRLHMDVVPVWQLKKTVDTFFSKFLHHLHAGQVYLHFSASVMDWLLSSYTQLHGSFPQFLAHLKYAVFDFFYSHATSALVHPVHRCRVGVDPVLLKSLPSVFQYLQWHAEGTLADAPASVHALLTDNSTWQTQLDQWLRQLDRQWIRRSIVVRFLAQLQSVVAFEHPKSFAFLYQLAAEETLLAESFVQAMTNSLKNIAKNASALVDMTFDDAKKKRLSETTDFHQLISMYQHFLVLIEPYMSLFPNEWEQVNSDFDYLQSISSSFSKDQLPQKTPPSLAKYKTTLRSSHPYQCLERLWDIVEQWMTPMSQFPCYEVYVYRRVHVLEQTFHPNPPKTLHYVLSHPNEYLSSSQVPEISLLHRLYMEAGKTISFSDLFEAFKVLYQPTSHTSHNDTELDVQLRFLRGMGELEYLGLIQKKKIGSKRKGAQHNEQTVIKLTWG